MIDNRLYLRVALKLLSGFMFIWLAYILLAGLFISDEKNTSAQQFDISTLENNQSRYFFAGGRELLVIKQQNSVSVFWAGDPVYGCRLEYFVDYIKPVCIDIRYGVDGYNRERDQWLFKPEFEVSLTGELVVY